MMRASTIELHASSLALAEAWRVFGKTAPNPPVGACLLSKDGRILAVAAHEGAGLAHAEASAIQRALETHGSEAVRHSTLFVTLEPCNHQGRTPPCTHAILSAGIRRVVFNCKDANPRVTGKGAECLRSNGVAVDHLPLEMANRLLQPYSRWVTTGRPWILHKMAFRVDENGRSTMRPPVSADGRNTFARQESLALAHELRRQSEAILTTLPTILADAPAFTVRHAWDHHSLSFQRKIAVLSRAASSRKSSPPVWPVWPDEWPDEWIEKLKKSGFEPFFFENLETALAELGRKNVHQLLVEAGPTFSEYLLQQGCWDERVLINVGKERDFVAREFRV